MITTCQKRHRHEALSNECNMTKSTPLCFSTTWDKSDPSDQYTLSTIQHSSIHPSLIHIIILPYFWTHTHPVHQSHPSNSSPSTSQLTRASSPPSNTWE
mmetsp:Transcript_19840/g.41323  ORF Transcript_19840/g.41323 Transcript_19840/m.41323 type:complete len:99 (-) Transcript_19840:1522-1818(-)